MSQATAPRVAKRRRELSKQASRNQKNQDTRISTNLVPSMTRRSQREALQKRLLQVLKRE